MSTLPFGLYLDQTKVKVSPLVPSIILDYYLRNSSQKYIIGTLIGTTSGDSITITNAFGVPYELKDDGSYVYKTEYDAKMRTLLSKGTKEEVVGLFFVRSGVLKAGPSEHGLISAFQVHRENRGKKRDALSPHLLLSLDPKLKDSSLAISVHKMLDFSFGKTQEMLGCLSELPFEIMVEDLSHSGLDQIVYGQEQIDTLGLMSSKLNDSDVRENLDAMQQSQKLYDNTRILELNVENIVSAIGECENYVKSVIEGEREADPQITRLLYAAISAVSEIKATSIEQLLKEHYQDLIYVQTITNLTQEQLKLS